MDGSVPKINTNVSFDSYDVSREDGDSRCGKRRMRSQILRRWWLYALLVALSVMMCMLIGLMASSGHWTGPSATVMAGVLVVLLFIFIVKLSIVVCLHAYSERILERLANLKPWGWTFVLVAGIALFQWNFSIESMINYSCEGNVKCQRISSLSAAGTNCTGNQKYLYCISPSGFSTKKRDSAFVASRWTDPSCVHPQDENEWCRVFTSRKECRSYRHPRQNRLDKDCDQKHTITVEQSAHYLVALYTVYTIITTLLLTSFLGWPRLNRHHLKPHIATVYAINSDSVAIPEATAVVIGQHQDQCINDSTAQRGELNDEENNLSSLPSTTLPVAVAQEVPPPSVNSRQAVIATSSAQVGEHEHAVSLR